MTTRDKVNESIKSGGGNNKVEVRPSTIFGAGNGIFSTCFIPKGGFISKYPGIVVDYDDDDNKYKIQISEYSSQTTEREQRKMFLDAKDVPLEHAIYTGELAHLANDRIGNNNALFELITDDEARGGAACVTPTVFLVAERGIHAGEEICVSYGTSYWRHHMHVLSDGAMLDTLREIIRIEDAINRRCSVISGRPDDDTKKNSNGDLHLLLPIDIRSKDGPNSFRLGMSIGLSRSIGCRCIYPSIHAGSDHEEVVVMHADAFLIAGDKLLVRCTECACDLCISDITSYDFHRSIVFETDKQKKKSKDALGRDADNKQKKTELRLDDHDTKRPRRLTPTPIPYSVQ